MDKDINAYWSNWETRSVDKLPSSKRKMIAKGYIGNINQPQLLESKVFDIIDDHIYGMDKRQFLGNGCGTPLSDDSDWD